MTAILKINKRIIYCKERSHANKESQCQLISILFEIASHKMLHIYIVYTLQYIQQKQCRTHTAVDFFHLLRILFLALNINISTRVVTCHTFDSYSYI